MIAVFGKASDRIDLGYFEARYCEKCQQKTPFHWFLHYYYIHIFFLFAAVVKKQYYLTCKNCETIVSGLPMADVVNSARIPFLRRYGLILWIIAILAILVPGLIKEYQAILG